VTYLKNVFLSVLTGFVAYILFVVLVMASGLTDTSFAKIFALISAVLMAVVLVISRRAKERSNG
jgi:ABC-type uncharacterized transport system permease subunit